MASINYQPDHQARDIGSMNRKLKAELVTLFGRSTVEGAIALCAEIKNHSYEIIDTREVIRASQQIRSIKHPHEKVQYCQSLDIQIQRALIVSMLFP